MNQGDIELDPTPFDDEEREIMQDVSEALENGELVSELTTERKTEIEASARTTMNPPKVRITTRLPKQDLTRLKSRALALGVPYQTLLASVVHRYLEGTLVDKGS